jgi:hypothetical protein
MTDEVPCIAPCEPRPSYIFVTEPNHCTARGYRAILTSHPTDLVEERDSSTNQKPGCFLNSPTHLCGSGGSDETVLGDPAWPGWSKYQRIRPQVARHEIRWSRSSAPERESNWHVLKPTRRPPIDALVLQAGERAPASEQGGFLVERIIDRADLERATTTLPS